MVLLPCRVCLAPFLNAEEESGIDSYGDRADVTPLALCSGLIDDIPSCETLLKRMEREAEEILLGSAKKVVPRTGASDKRESKL